MSEIPLTQGKVVLVDDEDFEWLSQWKWLYHGQGYAARNTGKYPCQKTILMHRIIVNVPEDMETDHINHNKLDNRRENLRICTHAENSKNRSIQVNDQSGFKGIYWHKQNHKWVAQISVDGKCLYLGSFDSPKEAARFYDAAVLAYHGDFANPNFEVTYG